MKKILDMIENICLRAMSVLLVAVIGVLFYQVVSRYLFSSSSIWIEEFARYGNVWVTVILFGVVIRRKDNIRVDILESTVMKNRPVLLKLNELFITVMEMIFCLVLLKSILELIPAARNRIIPGLGFSMFYIYLSFIIGSLICIIYLIERVIADIIGLKEIKRNKELR